MKQAIPQEVKKLYQKSGLSKKAYVSLRWRLCPFEEIEECLPDSGTILDVGCGYGLFTNFLAFRSDRRKVIGIDNSSKRLEVAKSTLGEYPNVEFFQGDIRGLDLPTCQGATMSDVLHHLPEQVSVELLKKIFDNLEPGGKMVIEEVNNRPFWKYLISLFVEFTLYPMQKINFRPAGYWRNILEDIGFRVEIKPAHKNLPLADVMFVCFKDK